MFMHILIFVLLCVHLFPMHTTCSSVHALRIQLNLKVNANVQNYAQVSHLDWCVTFCMWQGSWESENGPPLSPLNTTPASNPPHPGWPPPPAHHHQTPAAGSLPHLTPSSTYWAWLITGAQHHPWPPHLPPHWWDCPIWDLMMGKFRWWGVGGVLLRPKTAQGAVKSETKIKTSVIGVKSCHWWGTCCVEALGT